MLSFDILRQYFVSEHAFEYNNGKRAHNTTSIIFEHNVFLHHVGGCAVRAGIGLPTCRKKWYLVTAWNRKKMGAPVHSSQSTVVSVDLIPFCSSISKIMGTESM